MNIIETEIVIDKKTGEILFSRDHKDMILIIKELNKNTEMESFFEEKPKDIFGNQTYKAFCG